jgi:hypothetical protein
MKKSIIAAAAMLFLTSCVVTTNPDGSTTKKADWSTINPFVTLAKEYFPPQDIIVEDSGK